MSYLIVLILLLFFDSLLGTSWDNSINLDDNYHVLWNINGDELLVELQVRTHGLIGFGLSKNGELLNADLCLGWINDDKVYFDVSIS